MSASNSKSVPGRGCFVVLDGIDGCGKSTQARLLAQAWGEQAASKKGVPLHLREPGSTPLGERVRVVLLEPGVDISSAAEALLFCAARRQMLDDLVAPALSQGRDVICERFHAATFAYQGVAGNLEQEGLLDLLDRWAGRPRPDATVLLELPARCAQDRLRSASRDRIEAKGLAFQERVADGFRRYATLEPCVHVVCGQGSPAEVHARVLGVLKNVLGAAR